MKLPIVLITRQQRDWLLATVEQQAERIADLKTMLSSARHEKRPVRCRFCGQFRGTIHECRMEQAE